ncbi:MAG: hypothetical protein LBN92_04210 [Treponema sp.]|jgi:hypothetical protein|nr:hypothetical protein [Treponema sp.]
MFGFFQALTRDLLGKYGRIALDFCLENSLVIGLIVIGYGYLLIRAQNNLEKLAGKLAESGGAALFTAKDPASLLAEKDDAFWDEIRTASRFPLIAHPTTLFPHRLTGGHLKKLLARYILYQQKNKIFERTKKK